MPPLELSLQGPGEQSGLLEALLEACEGADRGGGIFAWTNREGARLLLEDRAFIKFIKRSEFELVLGVDSITDVAALEIVAENARLRPKLRARVLLHDRRPVLFHPKLSWFADDSGVTLITGSGNLTVGGLRRNWEAFTVARARGSEAARLEAKLAAWLASWDEYLLAVDDPEVLARAEQNSGRERDLHRPAQPEADADRESAEGAQPADQEDAVLAAELTKSQERPSQANFDQENFERFFGATSESEQRVLFHPVLPDGSLGEVESRKPVRVKSLNYRFELGAARELQFPPGGQYPIAVFVRMPTGTFLYLVLTPTDGAFEAVSDFVDARWEGRPDRRRRVHGTVEDLRSAWPGSPIWPAMRRAT